MALLGAEGLGTEPGDRVQQDLGQAGLPLLFPQDLFHPCLPTRC